MVILVSSQTDLLMFERSLAFPREQLSCIIRLCRRCFVLLDTCILGTNISNNQGTWGPPEIYATLSVIGPVVLKQRAYCYLHWSYRPNS